jgi:lysozyme
MSIYRNNLRISDAGLSLIKRWESCVLHPYLCSAGKWTIGYGHRLTLYEVRNPRNILLIEALQLLVTDVRVYEIFVNSCVRVPISQSQFDALVSLCFNIGCGNFEKSTLIRTLNAGDILTAANEFLKWNKVKNTRTGLYDVLKGLSNRRMAERAMFKGESA